jgi:hypothetical protein
VSWSVAVDAAQAAVAVVVVGLLRVVWKLTERVARLEGELDNPTKRERRG